MILMKYNFYEKYAKNLLDDKIVKNDKKFIINKYSHVHVF